MIYHANMQVSINFIDYNVFAALSTDSAERKIWVSNTATIFHPL